MGIKNPTWTDLQLRKNPYKGKLLAIEGIDGAGKTTSAKELVKRLNKAGYNASYSKEPTDDVIGSFIRSEVLSGKQKMNPLALQYLFNADRVQHMEKIEKLLGKGMIIIMDRYFWSSVAYAMSDMNRFANQAGQIREGQAQAGLPTGRQERSMDWYYTAFSILSFYHQFLVPDTTYFLQISVETALQRIQKNAKHGEIYDTRENVEQIEKNYQKLVEEFPKEFTLIDAERNQEEIIKELLQQVIILAK